MKSLPKNLRTWIEIDARAARKNYETFRKLIGPDVKLWSVVKSNAYGHGLFAFSKLAQEFGVDGFCVDSIVESVALRKAGIKTPILVLGSTLPVRYADATRNKITITVSTFEALRALAKLKNPPQFHLKIDTGFHRQGFYPEDIPKVIRSLSHVSYAMSHLQGLFTHFASAKDTNYTTCTDRQYEAFMGVAELFKKAGYEKLVRHASATGGTLIGPKYHLDAVRVGIGLYGLWPSKELEMQRGDMIALHPVLSWRTVIVEMKALKAGDYVGYDLVERVPKKMMMGVLPIGYWHGLPRSLSSGVGSVVVRGRRVRTLGRVSMDMTVIGPLPKGTKPGDVVTVIGRDGREGVSAEEIAGRAGTVNYEFLTRLNPLMERIVVKQSSIFNLRFYNEFSMPQFHKP